MTNEVQLETLVEKVRMNKKYQSISPDFVMRLCKEALNQGLSGKMAVKVVRNKLHQVGGAYFKRVIDYQKSTKELYSLPAGLQSTSVKAFCIKHMQMHASTAERLQILEVFFQTCLEQIAPITSILDLACGLNPLAMPWMLLADKFEYRSCDIYVDMMDFVQSFYNHLNINGMAYPCDLLGKVSKTKAQIAFLLKSISCLEQVQPSIGPRLLNEINAEHILVSFPVRSLSGRQKGMLDYYQNHFYEMISGMTWGIQEFIFDTELAFLVSK